jgi:Right handed beta helix region
VLDGSVVEVPYTPCFQDCVFRQDLSDWHGGAVISYITSERSEHPVFVDCEFLDNRATTFGGGIDTYEGSSPLLSGCRFEGNVSERGGGAASVREASATVFFNCQFLNNTMDDPFSSEGGGALFVSGANTPRVDNCSFNGNLTMAGIGGAIEANTPVEVSNSILWGDSPEDISDLVVTVEFSDVQQAIGVHPGLGNLNVDPLFQSSPLGELFLAATSPCVDAGNRQVDGRLASRTTRTDLLADTGTVDLGFHQPYPLNPRIYGVAQTDSAGFTPSIGWIGTPLVGNPFAMTLSAAAPAAPTWVLFGTAPAATPFSGGTVWIEAPTLRPAGSTNPSGEAKFGFLQVPASLTGVTLYGQFATRDVAGFALSDALEVTFQ